MRFDKTSRRLFLTGAGGAVLALPWLPSALPRALRQQVKAQATPPPKRFVALKTYSGAPVLDWYPRQAPPGYGTHNSDGTVALSQPLSDPTGRHSNGNQYFAREAPLSDFAGSGLSNVFTSELNRHLGVDASLSRFGFHAARESQPRRLPRQLRSQHAGDRRCDSRGPDQRDDRLRDVAIRRTCTRRHPLARGCST